MRNVWRVSRGGRQRTPPQKNTPIDKKPLLCQCLIMTTVSESINTLTPLQAALRVSDQQFADGLGIPLTAQWMQNVQDRAKRNVEQGHLTGSALALPPSCIT